jgi:peptidoglycan/xylan/chitin deacetylase (PgdA/CDA1 family)
MTGGTGDGSVILLYHRIARLDRDVHAMAVDPDLFADQLQAIKRRADIVPLDALLEPARGPRVAITFDDGYADNHDVALPALREADAPATVFVTTGGLRPGEELWWDRVEHVVDAIGRGPGRVDVVLGGQRLLVDVRTEAGRARAVQALNRRLRELPPDELDAALSSIAAGGDAPCDEHRRMTPEQVQQLAADGTVTIGAHTRRHANLGRLTPAAQRAEIEGSRDDLAAILGRPPTSFAYPFGMRGSFDRRTERIVRDAGFTVACANVPGAVRARSRFRLPRHIVGSWTGDELGHRLDRWLRGGR